MPLSWHLGTLTSWNPLGHSRPVTGLLYLYLFINFRTGSGLKALKSFPCSQLFELRAPSVLSTVNTGAPNHMLNATAPSRKSGVHPFQFQVTRDRNDALLNDWSTQKRRKVNKVVFVLFSCSFFFARVSRNATFHAVTRLQAWRLRNQSSFRDQFTRFPVSLHCLDKLRGTSCLLFSCFQEICPVSKTTGFESSLPRVRHSFPLHFCLREPDGAAVSATSQEIPSLAGERESSGWYQASAAV